MEPFGRMLSKLWSVEFPYSCFLVKSAGQQSLEEVRHSSLPVVEN